MLLLEATGSTAAVNSLARLEPPLDHLPHKQVGVQLAQTQRLV
jgi:hypothetical protein